MQKTVNCTNFKMNFIHYFATNSTLSMKHIVPIHARAKFEPPNDCLPWSSKVGRKTRGVQKCTILVTVCFMERVPSALGPQQLEVLFAVCSSAKVVCIPQLMPP